MFSAREQKAAPLFPTMDAEAGNTDPLRVSPLLFGLPSVRPQAKLQQ